MIFNNILYISNVFEGEQKRILTDRHFARFPHLKEWRFNLKVMKYKNEEEREKKRIYSALYAQNNSALVKERAKQRNTKLRNDPVFRLKGVWQGMMFRCYNANYEGYSGYKGRGILVCDEWRNDKYKFIEWGLDNGYKSGLSIDRVDNDGNYSPYNCKFSTPKEQCNNRRTNVLIEYNGRTETATYWAEYLGISRLTIFNRIKRGCTGIDLLSKFNLRTKALLIPEK